MIENIVLKFQMYLYTVTFTYLTYTVKILLIDDLGTLVELWFVWT